MIILAYVLAMHPCGVSTVRDAMLATGAAVAVQDGLKRSMYTLAADTGYVLTPLRVGVQMYRRTGKPGMAALNALGGTTASVRSVSKGSYISWASLQELVVCLCRGKRHLYGLMRGRLAWAAGKGFRAGGGGRVPPSLM